MTIGTTHFGGSPSSTPSTFWKYQIYTSRSPRRSIENEEKTEISSNLDEDINADDDTELFESNFRLYHGFFHDRQFHGEGCVINFHDGTHKTGVWNMGVLIEKKVLYTSSS